jgi:rhamnogalacturonyl hydrolase YesR
MVSCIDEDGCFVRHTSNDLVNAFNVRAAWALLTLGRLTEDKRYAKAALANADWTLRQENAKGFYRNNQFKPGSNANAHGIAYVLQGLLEFYRITRDDRYLASVRRAAERIVSRYGSMRWFAADIGENWEYLSKHICVTGYVQLAIVLFGLYGIDGDQRYLNAALNFLDDTAATQNVSSVGKPCYGAIKGSIPIYGRYAPLQYPNWATKFFIDALLAKRLALSENANRFPFQLSAG